MRWAVYIVVEVAKRLGTRCTGVSYMDYPHRFEPAVLAVGWGWVMRGVSNLGWTMGAIAGRAWTNGPARDEQPSRTRVNLKGRYRYGGVRSWVE